MARLALALAVLTVVCVAVVDVPLARWLATRETHAHAWEEAVHVLEYAIGLDPWKWLGVCVVVGGAAIALLLRRGVVPWVAVALSHLLARNLMLWGKALTGRLRPYEWHGGPQWGMGGSSFPSGHVVLFASLVLPLVIVYPRLRWLVVVPVFAAVARVMAHAHFASDVVGGFALCAAVAAVAVRVARRIVSQPQPRGA